VARIVCLATSCLAMTCLSTEASRGEASGSEWRGSEVVGQRRRVRVFKSLEGAVTMSSSSA